MAVICVYERIRNTKYASAIPPLNLVLITGVAGKRQIPLPPNDWQFEIDTKLLRFT